MTRQVYLDLVSGILSACAIAMVSMMMIILFVLLFIVYIIACDIFKTKLAVEMK